MPRDLYTDNRITNNLFPTIIIENHLTLTKAYNLVKLALKQKEATKQGLLDSNKSWNQGNGMSKDLASGLAEFLEKDIEWLKTIMKQLPPLPKCKHLKELHDKCEGKLYCMGCNQDL